MGVQIPDELLSEVDMSLDEFMVEISVHFYDIGKLSLGQARKMAGLDQIAFQKAMAERGVYIKYDVDDFLLDLETLEKLDQ